MKKDEIIKELEEKHDVDLSANTLQGQFVRVYIEQVEKMTKNITTLAEFQKEKEGDNMTEYIKENASKEVQFDSLEVWDTFVFPEDMAPDGVFLKVQHGVNYGYGVKVGAGAKRDIGPQAIVTPVDITEVTYEEQ